MAYIQTGKTQGYTPQGEAIAAQAKASVGSQMLDVLGRTVGGIADKMLQTENLEMQAAAEQMAASQVPQLAVRYKNDITGFNEAVTNLKYEVPAQYADNTKFTRYLNDATRAYQTRYDIGIATNTETTRINKGRTAVKTIADNSLNLAVDDFRFGNTEQAQQSLVKYTATLDQGVKDGYYTEEEVGAFKALATQRTNTAIHMRAFDESLNAGGYAGALEYIHKIEDGGELGGNFGAGYRETLVQKMEDELRGRITRDEQVEKNEDYETSRLQDQNFSGVFAQALNGQMSISSISNMISNRTISPEQGRTLISTIKSINSGAGGKVKTDPSVKNHLARMLVEGATPDEMNSYILDHLGTDLSAKDAVSFNGYSTRNKEDKVFSTEEYKVGKDKIHKNIVTTGPLSGLDPDEQAKLANANTEYMERVANGENATVVANDIVERYRTTAPTVSSYPVPKYGTVNDRNDLKTVKKNTVKAFKKGEISKDTFNREAENLLLLEKAIKNEEQLSQTKTTKGERS